MSNSTATLIPTLSPPAGVASDAAAPGQSVPTALDDAQLSALTAVSVPAAEPTLTPPAELHADAAAAAVWRTNVLVDGMWSIEETRNAWAHIVGVGWRRIFANTDAAFGALTTLAGQARQTGRPISCREEADGQIHEIYLW